jgi:hypothetical protein
MPRYWNGATDYDINIVNQALDLIHGKNIATLGAGLSMEEEQKAANIYEDTRDLLITRFRWNFALNSCTILNWASASGVYAASIPSSYSYLSSLPANCLRVLDVMNYSGTWMRYLKDYIACDINTNTDDFEIRYLRQVTDASMFDPNFREVLIIKLAQKLAPPVRDKGQEFRDLYALEKQEIMEAAKVHAYEDAEYDDENTGEDTDAWVTAGR